MEQLQDKLQYISEEIEDLVGAVAFGQSRLQEFHELLQIFDADISGIMHHRHYQSCVDEHRRIMAMLTTTTQSLIDWRVLTLEYIEDIDELTLKPGSSMLIGTQEAKNQCEKLLAELHVHSEELGKMESRMTSLAHRLLQKRRILSSLEMSV